MNFELQKKTIADIAFKTFGTYCLYKPASNETSRKIAIRNS